MACPGAVGLTFVVCMIAGFTPVVNAELYLLVIAVALPPACLPAVVLAAALGQMSAKMVWYAAGGGLLAFSPGRVHDRIERAREFAEAHPGIATPTVVLSSVTGIPPFFVVSIASGAVAFGKIRFLCIGLAGRIVRFAVVLAAPHLVHQLFLGAA